MTIPVTQKGTTVTQQHQPHQGPSVEAFLGTPYDPAEDQVEARAVGQFGQPLVWHNHAQPDAQLADMLTVGPGQLWQIPPDPMTRVADALEALVAIGKGQTLEDGETLTAELSSVDGWMSPEDAGVLEGLLRGAEVEARVAWEKWADTEAKLQTLTQVVSDVEAALGKSKAAPALAAKQVIEAWRNPTVPETTEPEGEEPEGVQMTEMGSEAWAAEEAREHAEAVAAQTYADGTQAAVANPDNLPGHTRTPHPEGADFCRECTAETQEWILWPCPAVSGVAQPLATGPEEGHEPVAQPAHDAPVEEWRAYARSLGYAGPEIDKANRSVIRTTLGIAQPVKDGA